MHSIFQDPLVETTASVPATGPTPADDRTGPVFGDSDFDPQSLTIAVCTTRSPDAPPLSGPTVPGPTPTPVPTPVVSATPRSADTSRQELSEYLPMMSLIADAIFAATRETAALWTGTDELANRAEQLFIESRRVAALCDALSLATVPPRIL